MSRADAAKKFDDAQAKTQQTMRCDEAEGA